MSSKINFIKLTEQELSSRIALLVSKKTRVIFWKHSPRYFEGTVSAYNDKLILKTQDLTIKLLNEQICLNFNLNEMEYFVKGKVTAHQDEKEEIEIELFTQCFRVEKREHERLQVYPYYNAYVYLKYSEEKKENIFFINKNEQKKNDLFGNIRDREKQKLSLLTSDLQVEEDEELIGFRVEDLSSNGLCFLASAKETEHILSRFMDHPFTLTLNFDQVTTQLTNVKMVYQVNFITQQFAGVSMLKFGVTFKENAVLKEKITAMLGHDGKLLDYQKEFEEFIKNE